MSIVKQKFHRTLHRCHRDVFGKVKEPRIVNLNVSSPPTMVDKNRIVFRVLPVKEDLLIIYIHLDKVVLVFMREHVSLASRDRLHIRGIPSQLPFLERACDVSPFPMNSRRTDNNAIHMMGKRGNRV